MDSSIFSGGSLVAAFVAGVIALFAPCCISVMLPAYFAGSFQNRRMLVAMTLLFAAGIATIILPLAMGASLLRTLIAGGHTPIFLAGGLMMLGLGIYTLLGGKIQLPMPGRRAAGRGGPLGVYSLGMFSGTASSCCAPVLAGVIALSGVASSFALALGLGLAYVFGMVAPLFVISLLWERYDWRSSRLFRPRNIRWRIGPIARTLPVSMLASGVLLVAMGLATAWIGLAYQSMPAPSGWSSQLAAWAEHYGHVITGALSWIPNWAAAVAFAAIAGLLIMRSLSQLGSRDHQADSAPPGEIKQPSDPGE